VRDRNGNMVGYKKDAQGQTIITHSTGTALRALAEAGHGTYQQVTFGGDAVGLLRANIDRLQKAQFASMEFTHYNEHYQTFLLIGLVLALLELLLGERKSDGRLWRGRFEVPLD
jgi:Ca-activated chloride channel family protein